MTDKKIEIEITQETIEAGLIEIREYKLGDDLGYALECIYRAMDYARASASSIKPSKKPSPSSAIVIGEVS